MQVKMTMRYQFLSEEVAYIKKVNINNAGKKKVVKELSFTDGGSVLRSDLYGKHYEGLKLPRDPEISI